MASPWRNNVHPWLKRNRNGRLRFCGRIKYPIVIGAGRAGTSLFPLDIEFNHIRFLVDIKCKIQNIRIIIFKSRSQLEKLILKIIVNIPLIIEVNFDYVSVSPLLKRSVAGQSLACGFEVVQGLAQGVLEPFQVILGGIYVS